MTINWTQFNVPTIIAVLGVGWGVANYISKIDSRVENIEKTSTQSEQSFKNLNARIDLLANTYQDIPYRVGAAEKGIAGVDEKQNRLSELLLNSVDGIRVQINGLGTKVEVMSSKMDDILPLRKTSLERGDIPAAN